MPRERPARETARPDAESEQTHDDCEWLNEKDREEDVLRHGRDGYRRRRAPCVAHYRAGTLAGRTTPTPSTAAVIEATNEGLDWLEFWPSADAQQLSACACVRARSDAELCESPLCIAHSLSSAQQAMRASGAANHPAQVAAFPAIRPNVSARAARRRTNLTTPLGCSTPGALSNERRHQAAAARQDHHGSINQRGATVMGFDQAPRDPGQHRYHSPL